MCVTSVKYSNKLSNYYFFYFIACFNATDCFSLNEDKALRYQLPEWIGWLNFTEVKLELRDATQVKSDQYDLNLSIFFCPSFFYTILF